MSLYNLYQEPTLALFGLGLVTLWDLVWKGVGLWNSAKSQQKYWFITMLVFNTAGLLPIIYLIWFKPQTNKKTTTTSKRVTKKK